MRHKRKLTFETSFGTFQQMSSNHHKFVTVKGPYHPFCMFEPNMFSFHTYYVTDNHFPKDKTVFQLSRYFAKSLNLSKSNIQVIHPP
ncbi:hypothetical protein LDENG_00260850 [Lucifuga dentata]|nr:hypothetical protein LDENG_00260850 [Lucifuga dentata]